MPWSLHKQPPLTAREIEAIKKALASGVTMDNVRKRFHRSPKVLKKLYREVLFPGRREHQMNKDAEFNRVILESMERVGTPPEVVYAYRKTGRVVTEENSKLLTQDEIEEWNAAIAEYFKNGGITDGPINA